MNKNDFDLIAPFYDQIASLVFGDRLKQSAAYFSEIIGEDDSVLILGGGTGKILQYIESRSITYVEKSKKMLEACELCSQSRVNVIYADFLDIQLAQKFEYVVCPFFLDVFDHEELDQVINKIKSILTSNGKLMVTDFNRSKRVDHQLILKLMHHFFRIFSNLESRKLQDINFQIQNAGFMIENEQFFNRQQIFSRIYRLRETL